MKKILLLLSFAFLFVCKIQAQTESIKLNLIMLIGSSEDEFKTLKKDFIGEEKEKNTSYYKCGTTLTSKVEAIIEKKQTDESTLKYFFSYFNYSDTDEMLKANKVLPDILQIVNMLVKGGKYTGRDFKDTNGDDITELKNKDGLVVFELVSLAESKGLEVIIYARKASE